MLKANYISKELVEQVNQLGTSQLVEQSNRLN